MTVPAELTERSYYTIIMGIRICVSEEAETSLALQYAAKCEKIHTGLKHMEIAYVWVYYIYILYLRINCVRSSNNTMIYIVHAAIKEHVTQ